MTIYDWITDHPDDHLRIIQHTPAPDVKDEHGDWVCGGEGESLTVFDSTTGEGDLQVYLLKEIINDPDDQEPDEDEPYELEFIPDRYWQLW